MVSPDSLVDCRVPDYRVRNGKSAIEDVSIYLVLTVFMARFRRVYY